MDEEVEEEEGEDNAFEFEEEADSDEDDGVGAANAFFAGQRSLRKRAKAKPRQALSSLKGGEAKALADRVHALMQCKLQDPTLSFEQPEQMIRRQHSEWLSSLHCGCSVLLHGFGSKRKLLEDFYARLPKASPVVVLDGSASTARVRDLMVKILSEVLHVPDLSGRSNAILVGRIRATFALHEASVPNTKAPSAHVSLFRSHYDEVCSSRTEPAHHRPAAH